MYKLSCVCQSQFFSFLPQQHLPTSALLTLHLFAHFWIEWELDRANPRWQIPCTELKNPMVDLKESSSIFIQTTRNKNMSSDGVKISNNKEYRRTPLLGKYYPHYLPVYVLCTHINK